MEAKCVSINDFRELNPTFAWTIKYHFDRHRHKVISGIANLFEESLQVKYRYDLSNCLLSITNQDVLLYKEEVFTVDGVKRAFKRASEEYFLVDLLRASPEIIFFSETEKGKRCLHYNFSKKVIRTNHRGQKARWKERRVIKKRDNRCSGRSISLFDDSSSELNNAGKEDFSYNFLSFLEGGMSILVEEKGNIGAISFNPNYFGCAIKFLN